MSDICDIKCPRRHPMRPHPCGNAACNWGVCDRCGIYGDGENFAELRIIK